jgi:prepilin-type N-terminal cleavage/methylation domain-containing protein
MMLNKKTRKGFTLLELLVVISIISILLALGVVAYSTAQRKGRDAKRRADIKALQSGFEQYYAEYNGYAECSAMKEDTDIFPGGTPLDPREETEYACSYDDEANTYCVCAELETGGGNASDEDCTIESDGDFYCLTNLQ